MKELAQGRATHSGGFPVKPIRATVVTPEGFHAKHDARPRFPAGPQS